MKMTRRILGFEEFEERPPVLLDIGASGSLPQEWKILGPFSIYVGFDPDRRELEAAYEAKRLFKKQHLLNSIVAEEKGIRKFYYTHSPFCSSTLPPDREKLRDWSFGDLFDVTETAEIEAVTLPEVLSGLSLDYVDWFKADSQGTDLRLFRSLGHLILQKVIVAEFEPGIMDAYVGEDKMHDVMAFMEGYPFWLSDLTIKGPQRISPRILKAHFGRLEQKALHHLIKNSAFWGEMSYLNAYKGKEMLSKRNLLLGWIFSSLKGQHGFSLELAQLGASLFDGSIFEDLKRDSIKSIRRNRWKLPFYVGRNFFRKTITGQA